jgi:hypothetical protein
MRAGFGLPQALMIILFISGIVLVSIRFARVSVEHYADSYTIEQARLFERSAMERALLEIGGFDRTGGDCWSSHNDSPHPEVFENNDFNASVEVIRYFLADGSTCNNVDDVAIETPESHGMVQLRIVVTDKGNARTSREVRLESVSVQRP